MTERTGVAIVGGGVVGLACAAALSHAGHEVVLLERHRHFGSETSSRNSEVIHAGLYYARGSLKAASCVEGRRMLYARAAALGLPHRKLGKLVVATDEAQLVDLHALHQRGLDNGAGALEMLDARELARRAPRVRGVAALWSPETGIIDAHALLDSYRREAADHGAVLALATRAARIEPARDGYRVHTVGPDGQQEALEATWLINAAGLAADVVAAQSGVDVDGLGLRIHPCKGDYFGLSPRLRGVVTQLVYPLPDAAGLGIHLTLDLAGGLRAGPDAEFVAHPEYDVDPAKRARFAAALRRYLPEVRDADLAPAYAGVRPKLSGPGQAPRDFVCDVLPGAPRALHLLGIESPGLTAAGALARRVVERVQAD